MLEWTICEADPADAGEILTLQRAAYVGEAQHYGDATIPPLTQTLESIRGEIAAGARLKAVAGHRIVGSLRARLVDTILHIGRIAVVPDLQGRGIGTALIAAAEARAAGEARTYALFTGERSHGNIRLYERLGYVQARREQITPEFALVHLEKRAG